MKVIEEWEVVLRRAWSMKLAFLIALFGAAQAALPYFGDFLPQPLMGSLTAALALLLAAARLLDQGDAAPALGDAVVMQAAAPPAAQPMADAAAAPAEAPAPTSTAPPAASPAPGDGGK